MVPAIMAFVGMGLFFPTAARAHDRHERQDHLEGRVYDRIRELAHVLDERAQHAAEQAADTAHHGGRDERRFLDTVFHFARQAADFHRRMDRYRASPWDVPDEVDHLARDAHQVNRRIHDAHVFEHTWDDWDAVLDVLDQMQRVTGGFDDRDSHRFRD
jgi:hypothetical protein